jgi:hypothetical protein
VTFVDVLAVGRSSTVEILDLRHMNKEADVLAVGRSSTGELNVASMQNPKASAGVAYSFSPLFISPPPEK